ncbi:MAG TPA: hypothetical protein VFH54_12660 [Mycobacteriales bacterium]|nr:hypothetical protein [Mycobacteriales bacterium]
MSPSTRGGPGVCRWCGDDILWLRFAETGKLAPIDAEPRAGGNIRVNHERGVYDVVGARAARESIELISGPILHYSHWTTCRAAAARRAAKRRTPVAT